MYSWTIKTKKMLNIMQIKTKVKYYFIHTKMVRLKNLKLISKCWEKYRATGTLIYCFWKYKMIQSLWLFLSCFCILHALPSDPATSFLSIYQREIKIYTHKKIHKFL